MNYTVPFFMKKQLEKLQDKNPAFSMRAMAAKLKLSPGGLGQIINGKKRISLKRAYEVASLLNLSVHEKQLFIKIVEIEHSAHPDQKSELILELNQLLNNKEESYVDLSIENFKLISKWYGLAIFEAVSSYASKWSNLAISKSFNISVNEVAITLDRLVLLELIERNEDQWIRVKGRVLKHQKFDDVAVTNHYQDCFEIATQALTDQSSETRITGNEFFNIDSSQLDELRATTYKYLDEIQRIANKSKKPNMTYQAVVSLNRLNSKEL